MLLGLPYLTGHATSIGRDCQSGAIELLRVGYFSLLLSAVGVWVFATDRLAWDGVTGFQASGPSFFGLLAILAVAFPAYLAIAVPTVLYLLILPICSSILPHGAEHAASVSLVAGIVLSLLGMAGAIQKVRSPRSRLGWYSIPLDRGILPTTLSFLRFGGEACLTFLLLGTLNLVAIHWLGDRVQGHSIHSGHPALKVALLCITGGTFIVMQFFVGGAILTSSVLALQRQRVLCWDVMKDMARP